jgi:predicted nuclease with TOPRIM domain
MAKLEKEKLEKLQSFIANKEAIIKEIGARTVAYNLIPKLQEQLQKLEVEQKELTDEVEKEHGPCSINIPDGEITPIEKKEE